MDHLIFSDALQLWKNQLRYISFPDFLEILDVVVVEEIAICPIEPLSFAHLFESPSELIRVMLYNGFYIPYLRALLFRLIS